MQKKIQKQDSDRQKGQTTSGNGQAPLDSRIIGNAAALRLYENPSTVNTLPKVPPDSIGLEHVFPAMPDSCDWEPVVQMATVGEPPDSYAVQLQKRFESIYKENALSINDDDFISMLLYPRVLKALLNKGFITVDDYIALMPTQPPFAELQAKIQHNQEAVDCADRAVTQIILEHLQGCELYLSAAKINYHYTDIPNWKTMLSAQFARDYPSHEAEAFNLPKYNVRLRQALYKMPVVHEILSGRINTLNEGKVGAKNAINPNFRRWLTPNITSDDKTLITPAIFHAAKNAFWQIINMVSPEVLGYLPPPTVVVHKANDSWLNQLRSKNFRAYSSREEMKIHIADNEDVPIIVHEIGHQLEYFLGTRDWAAIQRLLRRRHAVSGESDRLKPISAMGQMSKEPAYQSPETPVTGTYSMKYYTSGSTEIFSMSMQFFSQPGTAKELIDKDPLQSISILRAIQPEQTSTALEDTFTYEELAELFPDQYIEMESEELNISPEFQE